MLSSDEDAELRDIIIHTLETNGVLGKIKAELRASVFLALEEQDSLKKIPLQNTRLRDYLASDNGLLVVSLVREFLQFFQLDFALAVFDPEVSTPKNLFSRRELRHRFQVVSEDDEGKPVLAELLPWTSVQPMSSDLEMSVAKVSHENDDHKRSSPVPLVSDLEPESAVQTRWTSNDELDDPFYDEPLHLEHRGRAFSGVKENVLSDGMPPDILPPSTDSDLTVLPDKAKKEAPRPASDPSLLGNLPSLHSLPEKTTGSGIPSQKDLEDLDRQITEMGLGLTEGDRNYEDDFQSSNSEASNRSDTKLQDGMRHDVSQHSDAHDTTEQSVEEELDEDLSGIANDFLNSLSLADDTTTDFTVSNISSAGGVDYLQKIG